MTGKTITKIEPINKPEALIPRTQFKRVAVYARVSTQKKEQQSSIAAQKDYYQKLIKKNNDWKLVGIYEDNGITGTSYKNRTGFNKLMSDCENGEIDIVLTKSVSRFARNTIDSLNAIRKLKELGIGIYFQKEDIWTLDGKGEFLITLMSSFAQEESRSISENTAWGIRKRFSDGMYYVAFARFMGYDRGPKGEFIINSEQAIIVRKIYRFFIQGFTCHRIAQILSDKGVAAPGGGEKWYSETILSILTNEKYKGDALTQKTFKPDFMSKYEQKNKGEFPMYYVEGGHESIISPYIFDYVQSIGYDRNKNSSKYSGVSIYSSKVVCGKCGVMFGIKYWHSTSTNDLVWQCRNRYRKGDYCRNIHIYDEQLQDSIAKVTLQLVKKNGRVRKICRSIISELGISNSVMDLISDLSYDDMSDLAFIMKSAIVHLDREVTFCFIDGTEVKYNLPNFSPCHRRHLKR